MTFDESKYLDFTQKPDFQQILTNPILDIAARFWDEKRYEAFRVCYRSMRIIDDLIDERKADGAPISESEKKEIALTLASWFEAFQAGRPRDEFLTGLIETAERFKIPLWPWRRLLKAMLYDLDHNGFASFRVFLRYTEGAAIAPASVFMHLCGVAEEDSRYKAPSFDVRLAARHLAIFSYLVHIVRDFEKDQRSGLNYFASDLMNRNGLTAESLRVIANGGEIPDGFRKLIEQYRGFAEYYRDHARKAVDRVKPCLPPACQLSLEIIYNLYNQIFEKIDTTGGRFTTLELNPSPDEIQDRIYRTVSGFNPTL